MYRYQRISALNETTTITCCVIRSSALQTRLNYIQSKFYNVWNNDNDARQYLPSVTSSPRCASYLKLYIYCSITRRSTKQVRCARAAVMQADIYSWIIVILARGIVILNRRVDADAIPLTLFTPPSLPFPERKRWQTRHITRVMVVYYGRM